MTDGAEERAAAFLRAVVWAEHTTVWELLSEDGRRRALAVAVGNGLDRVVAGRIGDDLADPVELDQFLAQLVRGLQRDLRSVELPELRVGTADPASRVGSVSVPISSPSNIPGTDGWAAGCLVLSRDPVRGWCVDRLEPRVAGP